MRIYLAGPEVFHANARDIGAEKRKICEEAGHQGLFPLDGMIQVEGLPLYQHGLAIYQANRALMARCDAIIANLTPFRGPHADPGTAFELGYMAAQGKPCLAYSNTPGTMASRLDGREWDDDNLEIEQFGMADNLMLTGAAAQNGGILQPDVLYDGDIYWDMRCFQECVHKLTNLGV